MSKAKKNSGVALYLTLFILSVVMAIAFGLFTLLISEFEISQEVGKFVPAIYAADSGVERALYKIRKTSPDFNPGTCGVDGMGDPLCTISVTTLNNGAEYSVIVLDTGVEWCPGSVLNMCIRGLGTLQNTNRAIEANF